jgi:hypothetical protein
MRFESLRRGVGVAWYAARLLLVEPVMLVVAVAEVALLLVIGAGIGLEFEDGTLTGMTIVGKIEITEVAFFTRMLLPKWVQAFGYLALLGGVAVAATSWMRLVHDPLFGILLTAGLTRRESVVWNYVGNLVAMTAHVLGFSLLVGVILHLKGWGGEMIPIILGSLSVAWWMGIVLSWSLVLTMITDNQMSVLILLILVFFLLGPLFSAVNLNGRPVLAGFALIAPPTQAMLDWTTSMIIGCRLTDLPLSPVTVAPAGCLLLGLLLFQRRDF